MPTGYTAKIEKGITFREFTLECAHAFGALITLRDETGNSEIPEFTPSSFYADALVTAQKELAELKKLTPDAWDSRAELEYKKEVKSRQKRIAERQALRDKYEAMLAQVNAWSPPTKDHIGLKDFMIEQIAESIKFDCSSTYDTVPKKESGLEWIQRNLTNKLESIHRYAEEHQKEVDRVSHRNAWVKALKESL